MTTKLKREYPDAPIVTVGAVVFNGERVLLAQRNKQPSQGAWTLPGGAIEAGETMRQAVEREVNEECGLVVHAGEVVDVLDYIFHDQAGRLRFHYVVIDIACRYLGGELNAGDDAAEARWVHPDEFDALNVPPHARAVIAKAKSKT
ncbi:MAG: NUDIX hydrolase [Thermoflexales bacterium]|nr:NUDIX hydrolase [Thermoflexales bacterium]